MTLYYAIAFVVAVVVVIAILLAHIRSSGSSSAGPWPYYLKTVLSRPEQTLYHRLVKALPDHIVLAQVQVSRVLGVKKGFNFAEWNNRVNRLSYDFLVCNKDGTAVAAIELDDRSHEAAERAETDGKKDKATAAAGLKMIRWHVRSLPDEAAIRAAVVATAATQPALPV